MPTFAAKAAELLCVHKYDHLVVVYFRCTFGLLSQVQRLRSPKDQKPKGPDVQRLRRPKVQKAKSPEDQRTRSPKDQKSKGLEVQRLRSPKA